MKIFFRIISWTAGIVVFVFTALVVINLFDEDLDPGAQAALQRGFSVKDTRNGFFVVAGLYAPADRDAHNYGMALVQRWSAEDDKPRQDRDYGGDLNAAALADMVRNNSPNDWCNWNTQLCLDAFSSHRQQIEQASGAGALLLERYLNILNYPDYQDYVAGTVDTPLPPYLGITWAAGVRNGQCALLVQGGHTGACLQMLERDVAIARKMLAGGRTILGKMVPIALLNHDYRLLGEILGSDKNATATQQQLIERMLQPLSAAELDFSQAMLEGFMSAPSLLHEVQAFPGGASTPGPLHFLGGVVGRLFLKFNATLNLDFRLRRMLIEQSRLSAREYYSRLDEFTGKAARIVQRKPSLGMIYNPIGKIMLAVALPDYPRYLLRAHDLTGLQRLVHMQWLILQQGITAQQVPAFLDSAGMRAQDPYTERPLDWDAGTQTLSFKPRASRPLVPGSRYQVSFREETDN